jgi:hypothetical protein
MATALRSPGGRHPRRRVARRWCKHSGATPAKEDAMASRPARFLRSRTATQTVCAFLLLLTAACNEDGVSHPSTALDWKRVAVSRTEASIGDSVQVSWDYVGASRLKAQSVKLIRLSLAGLVSQEQELPKTQRALTFDFDGPVTVVITATDKSNRQIDAAFDVRLDSDFRFRVGGVQETHPGYPRLGQRKFADVTVNGVTTPALDPAAFDIDFTHFFGVYEVVDAAGVEDGRIDGIPPSLRQALPPSQDFFGRSFDVREALTPPFRFTMGSAFPVLDPGFLLTAEGAQFVGVRTRCDAVAFAGKVAYDGTERRDPKTRLTYRKNVTTFEPVFATVDLRSDGAGDLHVADIDIGNANQGLVLSVFHGLVDGRFVGTTSVSYGGIDFLGDPGVLDGDIKGSRVGFGVTTASGEILTTGGLPGVFADIASITWHVPFLPDTNLSGLN